MVEQIIRSKKKFSLATSSESHAFEKDEVYSMRFGNEKELDNLLIFGNFVLSNKDELNNFLSGVPLPAVNKVEVSVGVVEKLPNEVPDDDEETDIPNVLKLIEEGKDITDVIAGLSEGQKKELITSVEESSISDNGKKEIIDLLKKRTMSKCSICGKRKKKEDPFCAACIVLRDNQSSVGNNIV